MVYSYHPAAKEELGAAAKHYQAQSAGLGEGFAAEVEKGIHQLLDHPESGASYESGTRRLVIHGFPFSLIYINEESCISIYAVMHHARKPGYWKDRLR